MTRRLSSVVPLVLLLTHIPCWTGSATPDLRGTHRLPAFSSPPQCIALGDLNGDGANDLVVLSNRCFNGLYVLLSQDGQLRRLSGRLCPGFPAYAGATAAAAVCDVNEDGWYDLILVGASLQPLALFLNRGLLHGEWQGLAEASPPR